MTIEDLYAQWSTNGYFDKETRDELLQDKDNQDKIRDRFYTQLKFGTAGIRGIMGAGTNRINKYVVRRLSFGIAKLLLNKNGAIEKGVVIGYDSRNNSVEFAKEAAAVFAGEGIKVYIHDELSPVPVLSFSIRHLNCAAGVMITASHNSKEYNGYKAYGCDGAQMSLEDSMEVTNSIENIVNYTSLPIYNYDELKNNGKIIVLDESIKEAYLNTIIKLADDDVKSYSNNLKLVYTPVHGTGTKYVPEILKRLGFNNLYVVPEQMQPDGNFPTVAIPNPEDKGVYSLAIELAKKVGANLILATDPDADRTGVAVRNSEGEYILLNGNQIGVLLLNHILESKKQQNLLENSFVVSTIVSTRMTEVMCNAYNVNYTDVLTGFKFIGEQIMQREEKGNEKFIFGFEESYGYLAGSYARDKDAVASCMLIASAAAHFKENGQTLLEGLQAVYEKYGYYYETQISINLKGESGLEKMGVIMNTLRDEKGRNFTEQHILEFKDYETSKKYNFINNSVSDILLPSSDVLYYTLDNGWFCIRPSGTEPKIKVYFANKAESIAEAKKNLVLLQQNVKTKIMELV